MVLVAAPLMTTLSCRLVGAAANAPPLAITKPMPIEQQAAMSALTPDRRRNNNMDRPGIALTVQYDRALGCKGAGIDGLAPAHGRMAEHVSDQAFAEGNRLAGVVAERRGGDTKAAAASVLAG